MQLAQTAAFPETGVSYTLSFRARAEPARKMRVSAQVLESDFHDIGINRVADVGAEWARYEYTFVAQDLGSEGHYLPVFFFGTQKGDTYVADVSLSVSDLKQQGNVLEASANPGAWTLTSLTPDGTASLHINGTSLEVGTSVVSKQQPEYQFQIAPSSPTGLLPGRRYALTFRGRSGTPRTLRVRGIAEAVILGPDERDYALRFSVNQPTNFGACPTFLLGGQLGTFTLSDLVLREEKWDTTAPPKSLDKEKSDTQ